LELFVGDPDDEGYDTSAPAELIETIATTASAVGRVVVDERGGVALG